MLSKRNPSKHIEMQVKTSGVVLMKTVSRLEDDRETK